ncbi:MAG: minichromosome maintenance protein MCM [Nitrososphaerota archaeon]
MNQEKMQYVKESIQHQSSFIQDFVNDYLAREMHLGWGMERPNYLMTYNLDLGKIREYSESDRFHELTDEEVAKFHLNPDQIKKLFEDSQREHRENRWFDDCQHLLELLDQDYEETMKLMNEYLVYQAVSESDRDYPDFIEPKWNVINEERLTVSFEDINLSDHEGKTLNLQGYLTYVQNPPIERILEAEWTCKRCGNVEISDGEKPDKPCKACSGETWIMNEETVRKQKIQEALLTEKYESSASGFPLSLSILFTDENTSTFAPGDHISAIGKMTSRKLVSKTKEITYSYVLEVSQARKDEKHINITDEDRKKIEEFVGKSGNVLDDLANMYAPGIIGHEDVKKAIILQAAGSDDILRKGGRVRGNIHILLVGDPGTGKSQLLMATPSVSAKALYVTDASAAGLTAAVDEVNGKRVMVAGVMVLADNGIAAIDEIEKMQKDDRKAIHPALEQGEIHKSKAGLHASFKSRTSLLAAANPKYGRFIDSKGIIDQIDLEPSLLDRFDLVFVFKEMAGTEGYERQRAIAMLKGSTAEEDDDFLLKYIVYSKTVHPVIPEDIIEEIAKYFAQAKSNPLNKDHYLNARTLESLKRLSLASARIRLSNVVEEKDLDNAKELIESYLSQFNWDMDAISGITSSVRDCLAFLENEISPERNVNEHDVVEDCQRMGFSLTTARKAIDEMRRTGKIYAPRDGLLRGVMR